MQQATPKSAARRLTARHRYASLSLPGAVRHVLHRNVYQLLNKVRYEFLQRLSIKEQVLVAAQRRRQRWRLVFVSGVCFDTNAIARTSAS